MWFFLACAVVAAAVTVGLVVGRVDGGLGRPTSGLAHVPLPLGQDVTAQDVSDLRFDVALRGYRMEQVDDVLDRLRAELDSLHQILAAEPALEAAAQAPDWAPDPDAEPAPDPEPHPVAGPAPDPEPHPVAGPAPDPVEPEAPLIAVESSGSVAEEPR